MYTKSFHAALIVCDITSVDSIAKIHSASPLFHQWSAVCHLIREFFGHFFAIIVVKLDDIVVAEAGPECIRIRAKIQLIGG